MLSNLTKINGYSPVKALFFKEFWDHRRAILITPMVVTALFIIFVSVSLATGNELLFNDVSINQGLLDHLSTSHEFDGRNISVITGILYFSPTLLWISALFTMVFTALASLHDERKDGSILFWKSMPVSDTQEVLVKLATVIFVIPLFTIPFSFIIQAFILIVLSALTIGTDYGVWDTILSQINVIPLTVGNIIPKLVTALWILPIISWFMLVSSFSRRPPFLVAFAVPALIIATEELFFNGSLLLHAITSLFENMGDNYGFESYFTLTSFAEPAFWVGIIISAIMIYGCIQIRKRNTLV